MATDKGLPAVTSADAFIGVSDDALAERWGMLQRPLDEDTTEVEDSPEAEAVEAKAPEKAVKPKADVEADAESESVVKTDGDGEGTATEEAKEAEETPAPAKRQPVTKFQLFDDKTELEVPDNLFVSLKANKKDYERIPLDEVVRFAQMGIYNHEREQGLKAKEQEIATSRSEAQRLAQQVEWYEQQFERYFTDPEFAERAGQEFLRSRTPEARADRAERDLQAAQVQVQDQQEAFLVTQFAQTYLAPRFEAMLSENPTVNRYELIGRWNDMMAPLMVRGRVPANRLADVQSLVEGQLTPWVHSLQLERTAEKASTKKAITDAQRETQKAKRQVARAIAPPGSGASGNAPPKQEKFTSASDWFSKRLG